MASPDPMDVVAICTPTDSHYEVFNRVVQMKPRVILIEKPLANDIRQAHAMASAAAANNCVLAVNYFRRFEPGTNILRDRIQGGVFGAIRKAVVWYAKGLLNNASHFINLFEFLLGPSKDCRIINSGRNLSNGDCEPDFVVTFNAVDVYFIAGKDEDFSVKEIEILTEKGVIKYQNGGDSIRHFPICESDWFKGYKVLSLLSDDIKTDFARYQMHVTEGIFQHLNTGKEIQSDATAALNTQLTLQRIMLERGNKSSI